MTNPATVSGGAPSSGSGASPVNVATQGDQRPSSFSATPTLPAGRKASRSDEIGQSGAVLGRSSSSYTSRSRPNALA